MHSLEKVELALNPGVGWVAVERRASRLARDHQPGSQALVAWWDDERGLAGPASVLADDGYASVARYARDQSATLRIHVNRGQYEFFYKRSGKAALESASHDRVRNAQTPSMDDRVIPLISGRR